MYHMWRMMQVGTSNCVPHMAHDAVKVLKKNNEKSARSHPRLRKNASRLLALTTTTTKHTTTAN